MSASASISAASAERTRAAGTHTLRSLEYGLDMLRRFTPEHPVRGIAELADGMNVSRPTAHRYASTCLDLGYLEQAQGRRYRLARRCAEPGIALLGSLALISAARPIVRELRQGTGRTVGLAVLDGDEVLYLQRLRGFAHGQYLLEKGLGTGSRLQARETAAGRALLGEIGARPPEIGARPPEIGACSPERSPREQPPHIQVPTGGLMVDEQDAGTGARGLAITVRAPGERTSAIEIVVPAEAMSAAEMVAELGEPLRVARTALEEALDGEQSEAERVA